jgi:uncharacterized protein with NAD-binding domain and iron-sulfur cluster
MFGTYRGHIFYKMAAGMGDIVFAPLYEALSRRGVRFELFHRLENVSMAGWDREPYVRALELTVQARPRPGATYRPLVDVERLPCWPSEPDWAQLEDGEALRRRGARLEAQDDPTRAGRRELLVDRDFDFVVLGVGLATLPVVASELVEGDPRFRRMVEGLGTTATFALQLWMRPTLEALGWTRGSVTLTGFTSPHDTWSDMSHVLPLEGFPAAEAPGSVAYFCNVLSEAKLRAATRREGSAGPATLARRESARFIEESLGELWPRAAGPKGFDWSLLHPTAPAPCPDRALEGQFVSCNVEPTDRYTLCLPGTTKLRISPLDPTYRNLTFAGDWTANGLNLGCVEAAVMSGQLAAHALARTPKLQDIIGFDHP